MIRKPIYVITGGPGFGKTSLVEAMRLEGNLCSEEYARDLIESQQRLQGDILPWKNPRLFQQEILARRISFFESVPAGSVAFADRAIPDQLAFARYKGFGSPKVLVDAATKYRYAAPVFVTPPWEAIFSSDHIRTETFHEALKIHQIVLETYVSLEYQIIELPLLPVAERVKFIQTNLLNT